MPIKKEHILNKKTIISGVAIAIITSSALGILNWLKVEFNEMIEDRKTRNKQIEWNRDNIIQIDRDIRKIKRKLNMR